MNPALEKARPPSVEEVGVKEAREHMGLASAKSHHQFFPEVESVNSTCRSKLDGAFFKHKTKKVQCTGSSAEANSGNRTVRRVRIRLEHGIFVVVLVMTALPVPPFSKLNKFHA